MAKPEYAIREVSLAEVILFLLSAIILAAYHFDYRVATYIIFLDFFQSFKIIVALRQLMESKHCWFENDFNMDCVYPEYNFQE